MVLHGKGLWAYRETELNAALQQMAPQMNVTHILYKVGQGPYQNKPPFYLTPASKAAQLATRIKEAGFVPIAWSFTTLGDPKYEADMVSWAFDDGYEGFIFNVEEASYHRYAQATELGQRLNQAGIDFTRLHLCSYPTPLTYHAAIPYNQMGRYCQGGLMPMAYGTYRQHPAIVIDKWTYQEELQWMQQQGLTLPILPVLGFYHKDPPSQPGDWFTLAEAQQWFARLQPYAPPFISIFTTAVVKPEYYAPFRTFVLGTNAAPGGPMWVTALNGAVIFNVAGSAGTQRTAVPYRSTVQTTGITTTVDNIRWLAVTAEQHNGWIIESALAAQDPGPWPPLAIPPSPPPGHLITVWSTEELNVRRLPHVSAETLLGRIPSGTRLTITLNTDQAALNLGKVGQWFRVRIDPNGPEVWIAAWYATDQDPHAPPPATLKIEIYSPQMGYLNIRSGPGTHYAPPLWQAPHGTVLDTLDPPAIVQAQVGQAGKWIAVRIPNGRTGYAAAWYVRLHAPADPTPPPPPVWRYIQVNSLQFGLNIRNGAGTQHTPPIGWVPHGTVLESLEDLASTANKVGKQNAWLKVRTPAHLEGYVAAWYLTAPTGTATRPRVTDTTQRFGESAWIFGIHGAALSDDLAHGDEIRALYEGKSAQGWVLFTEQVGHVPDAIQPNETFRQRLWDWAHHAGYGVIIRLNHGYEPNGTLPSTVHYDGFAAACARWAALFLKHPEISAEQYTWIIQIGNAPNHPREHPGGAAQPTEHITPELYADAFNKAYSLIKAVLPNALIAPGAIDPYNAAPMPLLSNRRYRPLDYFQQMLDKITTLDAVILHAYTHGPAVAAITHRLTFADPFLKDHYFDFQTYRQFMERIPARWKQVPVYITQANHLCRAGSAPLCDQEHDQGWSNANTGWVRAAYAEIDAWNGSPYAQQIHALLLYRWLGDAWTMRDKPHLLADFKQALEHDYRWRK